MKRILPILLLLGIAAGAMGVNPYLEVVARKNAGGAPPSGIVFDASSEDESTSGTTNSLTHAQGSLVNGYAVAYVGYVSTTMTNVVVKYDGSTMTKLMSKVRTGYNAELYGLDLGNSASGSKSVTVQYVGTIGTGRSYLSVVTLSGVQQGGAFTTNENSAFTASPSVSMTTTDTGELVIAATTTGASTTLTANDTEYSEWEDASSANYSFQHADGTGGSVVMDWTLGASKWWAAVGVVLEAAP